VARGASARGALRGWRGTAEWWEGRALRACAFSVAQELGDDICRRLAPRLRDPFESFGVLALNADEDDELRVWHTLVLFDVAWIELG
jgi:hypothetical protein